MNDVPSTAVDSVTLLALGTLVVVIVASVYTELKESRIPNWITGSGILVGLLLGYVPGGLSFGASVGGFCVGFGFLFLFYMFGGLGGGDVKLMGAVGALLGYPLVLATLVYTAFVGAIMAVFVLIWRRDLWQGILRAFYVFFRFRRSAPDETTDDGAEQTSVTIPYGIAICIGCIMTVFFAQG